MADLIAHADGLIEAGGRRVGKVVVFYSVYQQLYDELRRCLTPNVEVQFHPNITTRLLEPETLAPRNPNEYTICWADDKMHDFTKRPELEAQLLKLINVSVHHGMGGNGMLLCISLQVSRALILSDWSTEWACR